MRKESKQLAGLTISVSFAIEDEETAFKALDKLRTFACKDAEMYILDKYTLKIPNPNKDQVLCMTQNIENWEQEEVQLLTYAFTGYMRDMEQFNVIATVGNSISGEYVTNEVFKEQTDNLINNFYEKKKNREQSGCLVFLLIVLPLLSFILL